VTSPGVPPASSNQVQSRMRATRRRDTPAELAIRSLIHRLGLRYRVDVSPLKGIRRRADLVFASSRVAVFVDGCFWHGCPEHATWPKANAEFWRKKISTNKLRDADTNEVLTDAGWVVLRFWEHDDPDRCARMIANAVRRRTMGEA
jgi:DNA mismatch endonuclease (patch repair protein)